MPAEDDFGSLSELAERLGLDDSEKENFISSGMKRLGYKARAIWEDSDNDNDGGGNGDFFASKRRERREVNDDKGSRRPRREASGGSTPFGY
jgi:hypothetical protein